MQLDSRLQDPFEIIVGTYEQYLLGYKVINIVNEYKMEKSFATHSHSASIRSVSSSKYYLASAGADETVCLYDMRHRRECGKLIHHNDTINCIAFTPENSHLFTCSNDGSIAAIRCGNWQTEKHWPKAHKGSAVNALAIHPTGKLALSTGADGVLRTWNLIKGRQAYAINLVPKLKFDARYVTIIKWSPNGEKYLLGVNLKIYLYSVESAGIEKEIKFDSKVICAEFLKDNLIAVGLENGQIKFCDLKAAQIMDTTAHDMRVKCIAHTNDLLVSASSSGEIKLWRYNKHGLNILQTVNCGARITCLSLAQACRNLTQETEVKLEEENEVRKESKLRLKQQVIVDYADDWEVTDSQTKASKSKRKKKRARIEDASSDANIQHVKKKPFETKDLKKTAPSKKKRDRSSDIAEVAKPQKKKKVSKVSETNFNKKRKEADCALQVALPVKKINKIEEPSVPRKKHKIKLTDGEDAPSRKIKKKVDAEKSTVTVVSKKKKRRITKTKTN